MYCSNCGNELKKGLNYCNSCGAKLVDNAEEKSGSRLQNITTSIGFIGVFGLVGFIFLVKLLLENNVLEGVIIVISLAYLATIFGISYFLINQLNPKSESVESDVEFRTDAPKAFRSANTSQLEEPKQAPASVVENTTRTLDEVLVDRK